MITTNMENRLHSKREKNRTSFVSRLPSLYHRILTVLFRWLRYVILALHHRPHHQHTTSSPSTKSSVEYPKLMRCDAGSGPHPVMRILTSGSTTCFMSSAVPMGHPCKY